MKLTGNTVKQIKTLISALFLMLLMSWFSGTTEAQIKLSNSLGERWKEGSILRYKNNFVETIVGNMPLVISVPHGGTIRPADIPKRECSVSGQGKMVTGADGRTIPTAMTIEEAFEKKYHQRPFIIISNIARSQVDQNREIELAACGNKPAEAAWYDFHNSIDTALALAVRKFGFAIYIDLHGHGHEVQRLELGYSLTGRDLRAAYENEEKCINFGKISSMQNYLIRFNGEKFRDLLWGENSLGTLFENSGVAASPSRQDIFPTKDQKFFSGGYNTRRYTSSRYPKVFGVQIESNFKGIRDTRKDREEFGNAFAEVIMEFLEKNINYKS